MKGLAKLPTLQPMALMMAVEPAWTLEEQIKREEDRLRGWVAKVGEERARRAEAILKTGKRSENGARSSTLPELLAEVFLMDRGSNYITQLDLGWARPDFVLFDATSAGLAMVWRIQGDYWHATTGAADASQKDRLLRSTARGLPIVRVVDIWESKIHDGDSVFDLALQGQEMPG